MSKMPAFRYKYCSGFTLLEILIAVFILGVVFTTIYASYSGTLQVIRDLDDESRAYKMARITIDRLSRDLAAIQRLENSFFLQSEKITIGSRVFGSILFWSAAHLVFDEDEQPGNPAAISYFVRENSDGSFALWRSDVAGPLPSPEKKNSGGLIICQNVQAFNLIFTDEGGSEFDSWDTSALTGSQKGKPPMFVIIELFLENEQDKDKPFKFKTKLFLPVRK
jgi:prepilin-type N-terminal cleavage/methylation domain-containing protein